MAEQVNVGGAAPAAEAPAPAGEVAGSWLDFDNVDTSTEQGGGNDLGVGMGKPNFYLRGEDAYTLEELTEGYEPPKEGEETPAPDDESGGEGSEDAAPEDEGEIDPYEAFLSKLDETDREFIKGRLEERDAKLAAIEAATRDAEIKARLDRGELLADADPAIHAAWTQDVLHNDAAPVFAHVQQLGKDFHGAVMNGFLAPVVQAMVDEINSLPPGESLGAEAVGDILMGFAQQQAPVLMQAIMGDLNGLNQMVSALSINAMKKAHGATVEANAGEAKANAIQSMFAEKFAEVEKSTGQKIGQEERQRRVKVFHALLQTGWEPKEALGETFGSYLVGVQSGKSAGKAEALKKRTAVAGDSAHMAAGVPAPKASVMDKDDLDMDDLAQMSEAQINEWARRKEQRDKRSA